MHALYRDRKRLLETVDRLIRVSVVGIFNRLARERVLRGFGWPPPRRKASRYFFRC